jgi:uncharacterized protein YdeI (YjbR/CyaY-like superfamily)
VEKGSGKPFISYDDIVDELICFGWIDSLPRKLDDEKPMRLISPINPRSLAQYENAKYYFQRFPDFSKRGILEWIKNAKKPATREKRIAETALKASKNIKANHPRGRDAGPKE